MKKLINLLTTLSLTVALLLAFAACSTPPGGESGGGGSDDNGNSENGANKDDLYTDYVFAENTPPTLIYGEDVPTEASNLIYGAIRDIFGAAPDYTFDESESTGKHEIVIGSTDTAISKEAKRKLRALGANEDYEYSFLIYASGSSVAIVYDDDSTGYTSSEAVKYFIENYVKDKTELKLTKGTVATKSVNLLDHFTAIDDANREDAYLALENAVGGDAGKALVAAMKDLYAIHDPALITWLANLYDPGVGGFYFSNSARDKYGFLPDAESTGQALGFINASGMLYESGYSSYADVLSDKMKSEIKSFLRGLQDPDGFFYHPQWTKAATEANPSRMARDMSYAVGVLAELGSAPVYDTPTGVKGDGLPVSRVELTTPLYSSAAVAVSRVALAASHSPNFENRDTLLAYLNGMVAAGKHFYPIGNEVGSQITQIIERDKELGTHGTESGLVKLVIDWFDSYQDPTNGTWDKEGGYDGVNALLKISNLYNNAGFPMKYHEQAAKSAMEAIGSDEPMGGIVDIYNTWYAVGNIIKNLRSFGGQGSAEKANAILSELRAMAPDALRDTADKLALYAISDGSYNYYQDRGSTISQGMPVADPDELEGTVNSTVIATNSITGVIYYALDLSAYQVPIFGQRELFIFLNTVNELGPVIKDGPPPVTDVPYYHFDNDSAGSLPSDVSAKFDQAIKVVKDDTEHANVLEYSTVAGTGDYVYIPAQGKNNGTAYIFEADIKLLSSGKNDYRYSYQIFLDSAYLLQLEQINGKMMLREATTGSASTALYRDLISFDFDKWYSLRIEYYVGNSSTVRIKLYVNDELISISDYYYNRTADVKPTPHSTGISKVSFYAMNSLTMTLRLDNLRYRATDDTYTPATSSDTKVVYNIDAAS